MNVIGGGDERHPAAGEIGRSLTGSKTLGFRPQGLKLILKKVKTVSLFSLI